MKVKILGILLMIISISASGQSKKESNHELPCYTEMTSELMQLNSKEQAVKLAKLHLQQNKPVLLLRGGIVSVQIENRKEFQSAYGVCYFEYGCVGPEKEILSAYNTIIFAELDKNYGQEWRKVVHQDVMGI